MELQRGDEIRVFDKHGTCLGSALVTAVNKHRIHFIRPDGTVGTVRDYLVETTGTRYKLDAVPECETSKVQIKINLSNRDESTEKALELIQLLRKANSLSKELAKVELKYKLTQIKD